MRRAPLAALALALALAPVAAQDAPQPGAHPARAKLPMEAPAGVDPLLADFVAVCSRAVTSIGAGMTEAGKRGWTLEGDLPGFLAAAAGFVSLSREAGAIDANLSLNRVAFPHLTASNCMLNMLGDEAPAFDSAAIGTIPGVEGGFAAFAGSRFGHWSMLDAEGEVVTVTDTEGGGRYRALAMARAVRTERGRAGN